MFIVGEVVKDKKMVNNVWFESKQHWYIP